MAPEGAEETVAPVRDVSPLPGKNFMPVWVFMMKNCVLQRIRNPPI